MPPRRPQSGKDVDDGPAVRPGRRGPQATSSASHFSNLVISAELPRLPPPDGRAPSTATFDVEGVDLCIVNALRRAIKADVRTAAVAFDPTRPVDANAGSVREAGIRFLKNTSVLHNEFLGHRVSMVPVGLDENQIHGYDPSVYKFVLRVKNRGADLLPVTTADFTVLDAGEAEVPQAMRDALFPPSPVTGKHILLVRLKPSPMADGDGEEVHLECRARLGSGREHARWQPVSACHFRNRVDKAAFEASLAVKVAAAEASAKLALEAEEGGKGTSSLSPEALALLRAQHAALDGQRDFERDANGEPSAFVFSLKSETRLRPTYLVFEGLRVLAEKVRALAEGIRKDAEAKGKASNALSASGGAGAGDVEEEADEWGAPEASAVPGYASDAPQNQPKAAAAPPSAYASSAGDPTVTVVGLANMDDFYEVGVRGEDHTLGNLVQGLLYRRWILDGGGDGGPKAAFIGYCQPHPLEDRIVFKVKCAKAGDDVHALFAEGLKWAQGYIEDLSIEWANFSGLAGNVAVVDAVLKRADTIARVGGGAGAAGTGTGRGWATSPRMRRLL